MEDGNFVDHGIAKIAVTGIQFIRIGSVQISKALGWAAVEDRQGGVKGTKT